MASLDDAGLSALQREFLDWLLLPPVEQGCSQNKWAEQHHMAASTLHRWKNDPRFIKEWEKAYVERQTQPDRIAKVLDALYEAATSDKPDVVAAKEWLRWLEKMSPQKPVDRDAVTEVSRLPIAALKAELLELAASLDGDNAEDDDDGS